MTDDCPRWLLLARHLTHLDPTEIARHHADHLRWCPHCNGWSVPPGLARDPQERP